MLSRENEQQSTDQSDDLLTVKQVAKRLHVSASAVYQLLEAGHLAFHRIGKGRGTIRVSVSDLENFLARCRQERQEPVIAAPAVKLRHLKA